VNGAIAAQAGIAELRWIDPAAPDVLMARLGCEYILSPW
jgi:8-oxo-dGTP diphosphatase